MKRLLIIASVLLASLGALTSCQYDDGPINDRLDKVEQSVKDLQKVVDGMNTQISSLQAIVETLQGRDQIVDFKKLPDGFEVTFQKQGTFKIVNGSKGLDGKDGQNGTDGHSPVIGVKEEGGQYYWTLDGEFMLVDGQKIAATAHISTPMVRVNPDNNMLEISFNNGGNWEVMGPAGESSIIKDATEKENEVTFVLADGSSIVIPKSPVQSFYINLPSTDVIIAPDETAYVDFEVVGADTGTKVRAHGTKGFVAELTKYNTNTYSLKITAPATLDGEIYLIAAKENGENRMCILNFEEGVFNVDFKGNTPQGFYKLDAAAGTIEIPVTTNMGVKIDWMNRKYDWFREVPQTKAVITKVLKFEYDENKSATDPRPVEFQILSEDGTHKKKIQILQWFAEANPITGGGKADLEELPKENPGVYAPSRLTPNGWMVENARLASHNMCITVPEGKYAPGLQKGPNEPVGKITSPILNGGCKSVTFGYARAFDNGGVGIKLQMDILKDGNVVLTKVVDNQKAINNGNAPEAIMVTFDNLNVEGDFQIVITNVKDCSDGYYHQTVVLNLSWTGYSK